MNLIVNLKSIVPEITPSDINRGFKPRYFAAKSNQIRDKVYEIDLRTYHDLSSNDFVVLGHINWIIVGDLEDSTINVHTGSPIHPHGMETITIPGVLTQNEISVMFLSKKIPAISNYLKNLKQFYVGE